MNEATVYRGNDQNKMHKLCNYSLSFCTRYVAYVYIYVRWNVLDTMHVTST